MQERDIFTYNDALNKSKEYFGGEELPAKVFLDKYALRDNNKNLLEDSPEMMFSRIAKEIYRIEKNKYKIPYTYEEIFSFIKDFKRIIPQGSPMYGIGNPYQFVSLSNCFVVQAPSDSYGGILLTDQEIAQISKRRGGVGTDISHLRPSGSPTTNAARTSTGAMTFLRRYSRTIREVGQQGRRGALLISMSIHHPEIVEFARIKRNLTEVTGANISIRLTDEFLNAVQNDSEYEQRFPVDSKNPQISIKVRARDVWKQIIENAHAMAEPGLLFWDTILRESPADCYYEQGFNTISTNPCGEITLCANDSCRLLLLNLLTYVINPFTKNAYFDFEKFKEDVKIAQRIQDDIIDLEKEALLKIVEKIKRDPEDDRIKRVEIELWEETIKKCELGRRTGTGITALGDTLAAIGIKYGSNRSIEITEEIYKTLKMGCYESSVNMAKELGPFPIWDYEKEKNNPFLLRIKDENPNLYEDMKKYGRRNISLLTTAPAGSVSILTQTTSGIEPCFQISYKRRKKINQNDENIRVDFIDQTGDKWQEFDVYHPTVKKWMEASGKSDIQESPWFGCCAEDINWQNRVKLQAAANRHVDHSISSTINLPEDVSVEEVAKIYETAWQAGCKGITVYRKNCRSGVMVDNTSEEKKLIQKTNAPKRPPVLSCDVYYPVLKGEKYFVIVGLLGSEPYEVFAGKNKDVKTSIKKGLIKKQKRGKYSLLEENGEVAIDSISDSISDVEEATTRMISFGLRHGGDVSFVVHQLEKTKGDLLSFAKVLSRVLKKYIPDDTKIHGESCKECGADLVRKEGCIICQSCGWSRCG